MDLVVSELRQLYVHIYIYKYLVHILHPMHIFCIYYVDIFEYNVKEIYTYAYYLKEHIHVLDTPQHGHNFRYLYPSMNKIGFEFWCIFPSSLGQPGSLATHPTESCNDQRVCRGAQSTFEYGATLDGLPSLKLTACQPLKIG